MILSNITGEIMEKEQIIEILNEWNYWNRILPETFLNSIIIKYIFI
jgi:hypothetical protein